MKQLVRQIALSAVVLLMVCAAYRWATGNQYTSFVPLPYASASVQTYQADGASQGRMEVSAANAPNGMARLRIRPHARGEGAVRVLDGEGEQIADYKYHIGPFMTVYDPNTGGFSGDSFIMFTFTLFCFWTTFLMLRYFLKVKWSDFYSYGTIYTAGFSIFALLVGALMAALSVQHIVSPGEYPMFSAYRVISRASYGFMMTTAPLVAGFSVAMIISNIALLRHERPRPQNVLGILTGVALMLGELVGWLMYRSTGRPANRAFEVLRGVYSTAYVYFECMLIGSIICGIRAARHQPDYGRDYILILGCRFRKDGTLTPLLRGRVDCAIAFWKDQLSATGKQAKFVPSGGQGADEVMPEAEAMKRYLLSQGVSEGDILVEDRSLNTYQNMAYSKAMILDRNPQAKVAYATTNYHVFRSGVWASLAQLQAESIGSRTKWWFWPNAFMRECAGLFVNRWKQELGLLAIMIGFFALLSRVIQ